MFVHVSPTLDPITALKALFSGPLQQEQHLKYFSYARGALITAIESLRQHHKISGTSTIWLPAFICDTVVVLLRDYSIDCKYYHVTNDLEPNFRALENKDISKNDFFLLVHYFGFPIAQDKAVHFCNRKGLLLIEDCAHSIVKNVGKSKIGTCGEAGIFGLRKALPIPNGGILYLKNAQPCSPRTLHTTQSVHRRVTKMMVQWCFQIAGRSWKLKQEIINKDIYPTLPDNHYHFDYNEAIDKWSEKIISATNINKVITSRRRNFQVLVEELTHLPSITIPGTLNLDDPETVPWIFFFYHNESERLINILIQNGISASFFPTLPIDIYNNNDWEVENSMYRRSVALPIHQNMTQRQLRALVSLIKIHT